MILSSLNGTWKREGWSNILELLPKCEKVKKLSAICKLCSHTADFTFRHGFTAEQGAEFIGGAEMYMPVCRECYNEKMKQLKDHMVLASESEGTTQFNESEEPTSERLLDMDKLNLTNQSASAKLESDSPSLGVMKNKQYSGVDVIKFNEDTEASLRQQ